MEESDNAAKRSSGPLSGVKVIDLTSVVLGPFATRILGDLGADVIKVETLDGDSIRHYRPNRSPGMSGVFLTLNRNKRSVCLDLRSPDGKQALRKLIEGADVFVHNMRPQAVARLGFAYDSVKSVKPDIVYCGAYGFGVDGPYSHKPAYDDLMQAGSGLAALVGDLTGTPGYVPTIICDKLNGQAAAYAIMAALFQRALGGGGQSVEVPMFETSIDFFSIEHLGAATFEPPLGPIGWPRILTPHRRPYETLDGYACILPHSDQNWRDFFESVGEPTIMSDPRFATLADRVEHIDELYQHVSKHAPARTTAQWIEFCDKRSIPCIAVLGLEALQDDPHIRAVELFSIQDHPSEGKYRAVRNPLGFSGASTKLRRHAPRLGEHSFEVLQEAGLSRDDVEGLALRGVIKVN